MKNEKTQPSLLTSDAEEKAYVQSVFLDYARNNPGKRMEDYPSFFQVELGLASCRQAVHPLLRKGLLKYGEGHRIYLTEKGKAAIQEDYVSLYHFAPTCVDIQDYLTTKQELPDEPFAVVLLMTLLRRAKEVRQTAELADLIQIHTDIGTVYRMLEQPELAAKHYLTSIYYSTSGLEYYQKFLEYMTGKCKRSVLESSFEGVSPTPEAMRGLKKTGEYCTETMCNAVFDDNPIQMNLCNRIIFRELVQEILSGNYWMSKWGKYFKEAFSYLLKVADEQKNGMLEGGKKSE